MVKPLITNGLESKQTAAFPSVFYFKKVVESGTRRNLRNPQPWLPLETIWSASPLVQCLAAMPQSAGGHFQSVKSKETNGAMEEGWICTLARCRCRRTPGTSPVGRSPFSPRARRPSSPGSRCSPSEKQSKGEIKQYVNK